MRRPPSQFLSTRGISEVDETFPPHRPCVCRPREYVSDVLCCVDCTPRTCLTCRSSSSDGGGGSPPPSPPRRASTGSIRHQKQVYGTGEQSSGGRGGGTADIQPLVGFEAIAARGRSSCEGCADRAAGNSARCGPASSRTAWAEAAAEMNLDSAEISRRPSPRRRSSWCLASSTSSRRRSSRVAAEGDGQLLPAGAAVSQAPSQKTSSRGALGGKVRRLMRRSSTGSAAMASSSSSSPSSGSGGGLFSLSSSAVSSDDSSAPSNVQQISNLWET